MHLNKALIPAQMCKGGGKRGDRAPRLESRRASAAVSRPLPRFRGLVRAGGRGLVRAGGRGSVRASTCVCLV